MNVATLKDYLKNESYHRIYTYLLSSDFEQSIHYPLESFLAMCMIRVQCVIQSAYSRVLVYVFQLG